MPLRRQRHTQKQISLSAAGCAAIKHDVGQTFVCGALRAIFAKIDALEKSEIKLSAFRRYRELFAPFAAAAGTLLLLGGALWAAGLRVAPA